MAGETGWAEDWNKATQAWAGHDRRKGADSITRANSW